MKQYTGLEVAIIGMSGRFPGANNLKSFWNNLKNGVESISFFTDEELINEGIDPGIVKNPLYVKANSFIENKEYFDSSFFNYRPDEAKLMDPQIRLFHECVWSAIEDAGFNLNQYEGKIGLFVGASTNVNWVICSELMNKKGLVDSFSASQLSNARFIASKISYLLNLRGPSIFLDTACSSSLVAIQQACNSLILGDSNIALAGGVTVSNKSKRGYLYADGMIHSRDGHCCPFDAKSSGTIAGEGAGVVVLKMLKNAIKDGDNIWAIIKGAGINNDGSDKVGYSAPSVNGQFKAIIRAQKWAKLEPKSISFIEAHGTATELGDPIEVEALNRVFGKSEQKYCAIGSVKSNIGHLDSAAGVAGFIKTVLAIKNKQIPPSINFTTPNPKINFHDTPFYVNTELKDWKNDDYPLRAGVSSFGIGGTNVHVVLEEAPETEPTSESRDYQLILLSAKTKTALENNTETIKEYIKNNEEISDIAFTLQKGRAHFSYRKMIVCNSKYVANDFVIPNKFVRNESHLEKNIKNTLVFMFSGQGSQYKYMCKDLYQKEILFRKELRKCFDIVDHKFGINLEPIVFSNENLDASLDINNTEYTQPILFIIEYALAKLLMHWGIVPDIMIGHSIGEYVAACISGVFSLEDALSLVVKRGKLMQKVPKGKMLSISISESKLKPILRDFKDISLAAVNSSEFCVVSGTEESLMLFKSFIEKEKYPNSIIHTSHAFHSYMMDNILDEFEKEVEKVKINSPKIPFISNYTGKRITDDEISKPGYWSNHLRHTVRFAEGIELILKNKNVIFLEVGPGKVLSSLVGSNKQIGDGHKVINTVRHPKEQGNDLFHLLNGIGELWLNGLEINWGNFYQNEKRRKISLPTYSFDKIKYPVNVNAYDLLNKEFQKPLPNLGTNNGNHLEAINSTETDHNEVKKTINENIDTVNNSRNDFSNLKEELFEMYSQFFGREDFDIDDDFFDIGGDSLKAFTMIGRIHKTFNIKLSLTEFLSKSSIRKLIEYIKLEKSSIPKVNYTSIPKAKNQDYYPLSPAQKRLYLLQQFDLTSTAYNMPYIIPLGKEADKSKIEEVFKQLINRHESFRTSVIVVDGEPVQLISKDVEFELEELSIENTEVENTRNKFIRAFDLSKAPFLRVALVYIKREDSLLMIDMHHIISDGTTRKILEKEFLALFSGEKLATLPLQYKDYSQWQNSKDQQDQIKDQEQYWLNKFEGEIPVLNLPSDYVRPLMQSHEGAAVSFVLSKEETDGIRSFTKENDLTLYMSLLSVFSILLSKLSGQDDIVVGTPIAGRNHADLENIVGMFVNTLSVRNKVKAEETIREFISSLKQTVLGAYENQNYQFEDLVEKVSVERDTGRNPIFDVMFNLLNQVEYKGSINEDIDNSHKKGTSKFDLNLTAIEYDNNIFFNLEYSTRLFKEETINRIINYFKDTLNQISKGIDLIIGDIQLISEEEKEEILKLSQGANKITGEHQVIQDLFRDQVENNPLKLALKFENIEFTYEELNKKSNQLARLLRSKGVKPNDIVGLMLDRSVDLIIGVLGIIKSGGAYLPIDLNYPDDRKAYMLENSGATLVLIEEEKQSFELSPSQTVEFVNISSEILNQYDAIDIEIVNKETDLFYVIYTSGSTGNPKGVMLEHRNLINLIHNNANTNLVFDRVLQFTSISFDVSFQEIFSTLLSGGQLFLISEDDRQEINKLFELVEKESIETLFLPTAYAKFIFNREKELSAIPESIKHIITAGEQLVVSAAFGKYLQENEVYLHNHYGPTESHVVTTITFSPKEHISELPAIGKPIQNTSIYILDESKKLQAKGIVGEIYIGGIQVARGYLKNNELTAEKFIDHPFKKGERLYRTGDLARWLPDGNIEFLGRIDHQVKIRGFRIELGEIESTLLKHENIKESIVLALEENNEKYLCAYVICKKELNHEEIRAHMSAQVPDYMLPSYFVELDELPLTSNGKVNRKVLPSPEIKAGEDYVAPSNEIEEKLVEIWSEVLNIDKEDISVNANFFSIGGHSLKATILTGKIYKEIGVEFPLREVFLHSTIKSQASQIETSTKKEFVSIPKAKEQDCYGLSSAQRRLYLLQQMDLSSTAYNMPYVIPIGAEAEKEKIEEAFLQLISRHESFRTSFEIEGEEPVQRIHEQVEIKIEEITITKEEVQEKRQQFIQAFDLRKAPLLRVSKVDIKGEGSLLMIDMHHIISDGVSHAILEQDFQRLYSGEELPPLILQYKDYSQWQKSEEQQLKVKKQENYWINKFEGEIPVLNLPIDMVRPTIQSHEGASVSFVLSKEETQHIKLLAKENDLTLYMSVLSVFSILLSKLGGQEDIIVGLPIAGRNHSDLENIVGMFVNTLAIRNEVNGSNTLKEFLRKLKQSTLEAYENQDYQFEDLVENISVERDISRNPLFDVMFNLLNHADYSGDLSNLGNNQYVHIPSISKFDLSLTAVDYGDQLLFNFAYCTHLFKPESIERFIAYFKQIVNQIAEKTEIKIYAIDILTEEEKHQLLYEFNDTQIDYPKDKCIHQLFEEQVVRTPKGIALVYNNTELTYRELNQRSNQLSHYLISKGLKSGNIVSIMLDRSIEMIVGILSVLKAGGTYCPIDINNPIERKLYILEDSKSRLLLTKNSLLGDLDYEGEIVFADDFTILPNSEEITGVISSSKDLSYLIYTSGTTGKPKGVMIRHDGVVNTITWYAQRYRLSPGERLLQLSNYSFDASVNQIFGTLTGGASLYIIEENELLDLSSLYSYLGTHNITVINSVPAILEELISNRQRLPFLQRIISGGEKLSNQLKDKIINLGYELHNHYGPTEGTIVVLAEECSEKDVSLGKPKQNTQSYILSGSYDQLQPIGVKGELCISGEGISPGYLNNEDLTKEKFISHPFKEGERLYRTGDLARWLPDGNIEFSGRIDHQVKIRGFRIELGEIESTLIKHKNIKESVVLVREENGDKYLCAYLVTEENSNEEEIRTYLSASLPDYMIPSYFVQLEKLPLTGNGKVNRKALPVPEIKAGDDYVAPSNATEEKLVKIWSEILNIDKEEISVNDNFFSIGGHSLKATMLTSKIHKEIGVEFPLREVFLHSTIKSQASQIATSTKNDFVSITKTKEQSNYPVSSAQKRLYLLQQFDLTSTAYNMPYIIPLGKKADKSKIEEVFKQLINRHESFRTSIIVVDQEPVHLISKNVEFEIEEISIEKPELEDTRNKFIKPFDLSKAPFLRAAIVDIKGEAGLLMIDMHHIISDGTSHAILEKEFQALLLGKELAPLPLQYKDYSQWQNSKEQQELIKDQEQYWLNKFEGEIPVLNLPTDYARPVMQSHEGATVNFVLSKEETEAIRLFTKENDLTLYMSLLSVFSILLSKLSGQDDIIVGTPIAGRNHADLENIVGMFINTLSIRNEVKAEETIQEFVSSLKQTVLGAYENQ
ncbi:MAG: amino acid adenylation domain-containing protein, partial [Bacteroidales bacterium]|nr:amino acid adenylation domain-containing protein [Bacteroidales bacterium]